ncbi:BnaA08g14460D [Brassica napus]|uniref:BnaA08g14460D protein n=1 Tax=Brassica napus TaxID=3708 RepID=A0A078FIP4_BRANA|nr:BnaA08g14460D [Brassica napus]
MDTVDSYEISNQSSTILSAAAEPTDNTESSAVRPPELSPVDVSALQLLSINLESLFDSPEAFYGDAKLILADDREQPPPRRIRRNHPPPVRSST